MEKGWTVEAWLPHRSRPTLIGSFFASAKHLILSPQRNAG